MTLRIKKVAKSRGFKLDDIAEKLGINRVTLSRNINGNPTIETLQKIADVLEVDLKQLIESDKEETIYVKKEDGSFESIGTINREKK